MATAIQWANQGNEVPKHFSIAHRSYSDLFYLVTSVQVYGETLLQSFFKLSKILFISAGATRALPQLYMVLIRYIPSKAASKRKVGCGHVSNGLSISIFGHSTIARRAKAEPTKLRSSVIA